MAQQQGQSRWQKGEKQRQTGALYCLTLIRGLVRGGVRPRLPTPTAFVRVVWWVRRERYNMTCLTVSQSGENMLNLLGTSLLLAPVHSSTWLVFLLWFSCCFSKPGARQPQSTVGNMPTVLPISMSCNLTSKKRPKRSLYEYKSEHHRTSQTRGVLLTPSLHLQDQIPFTHAAHRLITSFI